MIINYHNHTVWSDGTTSIAEMIAGARRVGVGELGISDHFVLMPGGATMDWAMPPDALGDYVAELAAAARESADPVVRIGVEADYLPETLAETRAALARHPFDYVIGSVHLLDGFLIDYDAAEWRPLSREQVNDVWRGYWRRIRALAESRAFDIVGHLDLPKKFGYRPAVDLSAEEGAALDAIAAAGMTIEINTAGWDKPIGEAYPSPALLREARRRDIPLMINADAHAPEQLAQHYPRARRLARDAGYTSLVRYEKRARISCEGLGD